MMLDIFIKNADIITQDENRQIINANIGIKDKSISYIGNDDFPALKTLDATNKIVIPGLINGHMHFGEYFIRGYDNKLTTEKYIEYAEEFNLRNHELKEEIRIISTKIAILESLKYGSTTLMGLRGFDCAEQYGLRLYMGYPLMKSKKLGNYIDNVKEKIKNLKNDGLNNYFIGLHSIKWVDEDILNTVSELFNSTDLKLSVHVCETEKEIIEINDKYKMTPIEVLNKYNLLNEKTLLVHCNYLSDNDINLIKKHNCSVVVCPNSNLKLKNKIADVEKLLSIEINVMIGTDGAATNDNMNLIDSCKTLALLTNIKPSQILDMVTVNPEQYFNNNIGAIKIGNKADIVIIDKTTEFINKEKYINNLIFTGQIWVKDIIIDGQFVMLENKFRNLDIDDIHKEKDVLLEKLNFSGVE